LERETNHIHFNRKGIVVSPKGALGESQVMPETAYDIIRWSGRKDITVKDISNRIVNLWLGKWYFSNAYFNVFPYNRDKAISSYFMGYSNKRMNWKYVNYVKTNGQWNRRLKRRIK